MSRRIVLNLVGGGIRGAVQTVVLDALERELGPVAQFADLVVGNSTGGILAGLLTISWSGKVPLYSAAEAQTFYQKEGPGIFKRSWYDVSALLQVKYPAEPIEKALKQYMGEAMLSNAMTNTMIAYADWRTYSLGLFKSHKAKLDKTLDVAVWYAARCTSAANTYFPHKNGLVDGGVISTDPGMFALTEAKKLWPADDIHLITIGTGRHVKPFPIIGSENWGSIKLIEPTVDFLTTGPANEVKHMTEVWNPGRCYLIDGDLTPGIIDPAMDAASPENINQLIAFGHRLVAGNKTEMDRIVAACK